MQSSTVGLPTMRVLLDTNVWSYVGRENAVHDLTRWARMSGATVVVAPASLLEIVRTPNRHERARTLTAITRRRWERLPTEAQSEAKEIANSVRRHRPDWLLHEPRPSSVKTYEAFWSNEVWRVARKRPDNLLAQLKGEPNITELLVASQLEMRDDWRLNRAGEKLNDVVVEMDKSTIPELKEGWRGDRVPFWRVSSSTLFWRELAVLRATRWDPRTGSSYQDWLGVYVDVAVMTADRGAFNEFWYYLVSASEVPRNWIRWATHHAQLDNRIETGNPVDAQLSAYLLDCDLFCTADRRFARVIERVRREAPCDLPLVRLLSPNRPVISALADVMPQRQT